MITRNVIVLIAGLLLIVLPLADFSCITSKLNLDKYKLGCEILVLDDIYSINTSSTTVASQTNVVIITSSKKKHDLVDVKCVGGIDLEAFLMSTTGDGPFIGNANFSVVKDTENRSYKIRNLFIPGNSITTLVIMGSCEISVTKGGKPIPKASITSQFDVVGFLLIGLGLITLVVLAIFNNMFSFVSEPINANNKAPPMA